MQDHIRALPSRESAVDLLRQALSLKLRETGQDLLTIYGSPKSQGSFSDEISVLVLLWALVALGPIQCRKIVGWKDTPKVAEMLGQAA